MSIKLMSAAWDLDIPASEKMVLLALCDRADDNGESCFLSVGAIARKCSKSERSIQGAIRRLRDTGFLTFDERTGRTNLYHLNPRKICTPAEIAPPQKTTKTPAEIAGGGAEVADDTLLNRNDPSKVKSASADTLTIEEVAEDWNAMAASIGLPIVRKLTKVRRRQFKVRLREYPDIEDWQRAFKTIRDTPWMHGRNDREWRADFDFLLQAKSFTRLSEGAYGQT